MEIADIEAHPDCARCSHAATCGDGKAPCEMRKDDLTTDAITFMLNGKPVRLTSRDGLDPRMTLLDYLREHTRLTGTKASCTQGGCGACNVMLTTYKNNEVQFSSVNACNCCGARTVGYATYTRPLLTASLD
jgi:xanthine dehydrogenase iron-sulfur cluster and FAD-binding subunit A